MASEGPNNSGTMASDDSVGTVTWSNPDYAKATSDSLYAQASAVTSEGTFGSHYLKATNFGFSIPSGATINGIKVEFNKDKFTGSAEVKDTVVKIIKGGSLGSENKAETAIDWSESFSYVDYGDSTDLWSESWTAGDINSSDFGVVMSVNITKTAIARVDHIRITVYYTEPPLFSNQTKSSAISPTNLTKNDISPTNLTKNDSTFTNQTKT